MILKPFRDLLVATARAAEVLPSGRVFRSTELVDGTPCIYVDKLTAVNLGGLLDLSAELVAIPDQSPDLTVMVDRMDTLADRLAAQFLRANFRLDAIYPIREQAAGDGPPARGWSIHVATRTPAPTPQP